MIDVMHWFASMVVLSVALARLEAINVSATGVATWLTRAIGWALLGIDSFAGCIEPLFNHIHGVDRLGLIGIAFIAFAYRWEGATRYEGVRRRANDR